MFSTNNQLRCRVTLSVGSGWSTENMSPASKPLVLEAERAATISPAPFLPGAPASTSNRTDRREFRLAISALLTLVDGAVIVIDNTGATIATNDAFNLLRDAVGEALVDHLVSERGKDRTAVACGHVLLVRTVEISLDDSPHDDLTAMRIDQVGETGRPAVELLRDLRTVLTDLFQMVEARSAPAEVPATTIDLRTLTPKERQVLDRLKAGYRVSSIARDMFVSEHTVRSHLKSIFRKLEVRSQSDLFEKLLATDRQASEARVPSARPWL
jgi:DNA-binding CsgD family transcriptional regulator